VGDHCQFGRYIEIGRKDIDTQGYLPMFPFINNAMFAGVDMTTIIDGADESALFVMQSVFDLMEAGTLRPLHPIQTYPISQAKEGFRLLQSGMSMGKIVLEIQSDAVVPVREGPDSDYRFSKDATYVVAGGLGGIGRQICRWMVRHGASQILLLTRSGCGGDLEKLKLIAELEAQGV
jgi:hypothetical protein